MQFINLIAKLLSMLKTVVQLNIFVELVFGLNSKTIAFICNRDILHYYTCFYGHNGYV